MYTTGNIVSYAGKLYIARGVNFNNIVPTNTNYWSVYTPTSAPAPAPAPSTGTSCAFPTWNGTTRYMSGDKVMHQSIAYVALPISNTVWNVNSAPHWTPQYWSKTGC